VLRSFAGWSGGTGSAAGCSGTSTCSITLAAASTVTAAFNQNPQQPGNTTTTTGGHLETPKTTLVCPSGHTVTIKLPTGRKRLARVKVTVSGHPVKVVGGKGHPKIIVSLLHRIASVVTIKITARQHARAYKRTYRYKPCRTV